MKAAGISAAALIAATAIPALAGTYCQAIEPVPGKPLVVSVEKVGEPFCGVAKVQGKYVKIEEEAAHKVKSSVMCSTSGRCEQVAEYYMGSRESTPYIVVFRGQRNT